MSKPKTVFIVAGEASGDLHAANLSKELIALDSTIKLEGMGGKNMREAGVDMSGHSAKTLEEISDTSFDVLIAFTEDAAAAARAVFDDSDTMIEVWPIPDPTAGAQDVRAMMDNYRAVRENIDMRLTRRFT